MSTEKIAQMEEILKNAPPGRESYFKLKHFIIEKEPTHQGKLWKILMELKVRSEALEGLGLEVEETKDNRKLLEIHKKKMELQMEGAAYLDVEEMKIHNRQLDRKLVALDKKLSKLEDKIKSITDESEFFVKSFESLNQIEELKNYDDFKAQTEYWNAKLSEEMNLRALLGAPMNMDLINSTLSLPDNAPIKKATLYMINEKQLIAKSTSKQIPKRED